MVKIRLKVVDIEDVELKRLGKEPNIFTRIFVLISYQRKDGDFLTRRAILDTGAIVSILPASIWKQLDIDVIGYHSIKGIVKKESCLLPVKICLVKNKLIDEFGNETKIFKSLIYCASSNDVPVIFGIKDGLDKFKLNLDIKQKDAWLIN